MPLIEFKCECGASKNRMVKNSELKGLPSKENCLQCGKENGMIRQLGGAKSHSVMTIDDGRMTKAVEVMTNFAELAEDRSKRNGRTSES